MKKFSNNWFKSLTDEELSNEREPIRKKAVNEGDEHAWDLLNKFDNEQIDRMNAKYEKEHPNGHARHREHGWYLPNDD